MNKTLLRVRPQPLRGRAGEAHPQSRPKCPSTISISSMMLSGPFVVATNRPPGRNTRLSCSGEVQVSTREGNKVSDDKASKMSRGDFS